MKPTTPFSGKMRLIALAAGMTLASGAAVAQTAKTTGCTPQEKSAQTLNQKLDKTQGVICPPDVDPGMKQPAPPGTPGGNPNIQPK